MPDRNAVILGRKGGRVGGKSRSVEKSSAARRNGKLGGRPSGRKNKTPFDYLKSYSRIATLLLKGLKPKEIRVKYPDVSPSTISKIREKLNLPKFQRGGVGIRDQGRLKIIRELKSKGVTYAAIGQKFGISRQAVQNCLRYDVPIPTLKYCVQCGTQTGILHRHHTDYLTGEVVRLCVSCHAKKWSKDFSARIIARSLPPVKIT